MALGRVSRQLGLLDPVTRFCDDALASNSIYAFLRARRDALFGDAMFSDLFAATTDGQCHGRLSPPVDGNFGPPSTSPDARFHRHARPTTNAPT